LNKKLALVIYKYFPYGGLQHDFLNVALELSKRDVDMTIYCRKWEGDIPSKLKVKELQISGYSNHKKDQNFYHQFVTEISNNKPRIIFGFNKMPDLDIYFAGDTCYRNSNASKSFPFKLTPRYKHFNYFERAVFNREKSNLIFLLNEKQKNIFKHEYETQESRLRIIPPGLSDNWLSTEVSFDLRQEVNIKKSSKILLFVGSDFFRKGLDRAIKSLANLQNINEDVYLIVAGEDNKKSFEVLCKKLGVSNRVIFLGPRKDVKRLMMNSDILIHPAREEAAGNVIIEAMQCSLPVLISGEVGYSDLVKSKGVGLVTKEGFIQEDLNRNLYDLLKGSRSSVFQKKLNELSKTDFYNSRYSYIANIVEEYLYA